MQTDSCGVQRVECLGCSEMIFTDEAPSVLDYETGETSGDTVFCRSCYLCGQCGVRGEEADLYYSVAFDANPLRCYDCLPVGGGEEVKPRNPCRACKRRGHTVPSCAACRAGESVGGGSTRITPRRVGRSKMAGSLLLAMALAGPPDAGLNGAPFKKVNRAKKVGTGAYRRKK